MEDVKKILPESNRVTLESGKQVEVVPLKSRQFFRLLRILTHGAAPNLLSAQLDFDGDGQEFATRLALLVLLALPDAEDEAIYFVQSMVQPVGIIERVVLNKADKERNAALWEDVTAELTNPSLNDLVSIVEAVIKREAEDLQALGKRLSQMMALAVKTGQVPSPEEKSQISEDQN